VTVKVDVSKLNAVQTRGTLKTGTVLIGLRASASAARATAAGVGRLLGLDAWRENVHNGLVSAVNAASVLRP